MNLLQINYKLTNISLLFYHLHRLWTWLQWLRSLPSWKELSLQRKHLRLVFI